MTTDKHKITTEIQADLDAVDAALAGATAESELTDLGSLALELRSERPEPDPFFTRALDAKAAAGFPRSRPTWRQVLAPTLIPGAVASVLIVVVIGATVIGGSTTDESEIGGAGSTAATSEGVEELDATAEDSAAGGGGSAAAPSMARQRADKRSLEPAHSDEAAPPAGGVIPFSGPGSTRSDGRQSRVQETSASLTLSAAPKRIDEVAAGVRDVTRRMRGYVVSSSVSTTDGDGGGGIFEIRVPSARLQATLDELAKLGHVSQSQTATQDITGESVSARDRLQEARAERKALLRRLERASTQTEIDSIKAQLRIVSARIAAAKGDVARVNNRASFSNIAVSLVADPSAGEPGTDDGQWSPGDAARDALRVLEVIAGIALIALAIGIPVALLVTLLLAAARVTAKRRRERALDAI